MSETCLLVHAFADGELDAAEAGPFRLHLAECGACQREFADLQQLARLAEGLAASRRAALASQASQGSQGSQGSIDDVAPSTPSVTPIRSSIAGIPGGARRRAPWLPVGGALAAAALLVGLLAARGLRGGPDPDLLRLAQQGSTRRLPSRLSRPEVAGYRPYDVALGGLGAPGDAGSLKAHYSELARLERRGDSWGVATTWLLDGDPERAALALKGATAARPSPGLLSDRAAAALALGRADEALARADEALGLDGGWKPARWNRALALVGLGLRRAAAEQFESIAADGEAGWSDEARARSQELRRPTPGSITGGSLPGTIEHGEAQRLVAAGGAEAARQALLLAQRGLRLAQRGSSTELELLLLDDLASAARALGQTGLAAAYAHEAQLRRSLP